MRRLLPLAVALGLAALGACASDYASNDASGLDAGPIDAGPTTSDTGTPDRDAAASLAISAPATTLTFDDKTSEQSIGIDLHATGTLGGPVSIVLSGLPPGIAADPPAASIDDPASRPTIAFRFYRAAVATTGTYLVTATATAGALTSTLTFTIVVTYGNFLPGQLDNSFGAGGIATIDGTACFVILPDGGFYTAARVDAGGSKALKIQKFATDATLLTTATLNLDLDPKRIQTDASGGLVIAGNGADLASLVVVRMTSAGALDTSFNANTGVYRLAAPANLDWAVNGLVVASDRIVLTLSGEPTVDHGATGPNRMVQLAATGEPDPSFTSATISGYLNDLALAPSGAIVGVGNRVAQAVSYGTVMSFAHDGSITTTGESTLGSDTGILEAIASIGTDGSVVGYGGTLTPRALVIARFTAAGAIDPTFGTAGYTATPYPTVGVEGIAATRTLDGHYVGMGYQYESHFNQVFFARYRSDGQLDPSFGSSGITVAQLPIETQLFYRGQVVDNGSAIVAGFAGGTVNGRTLWIFHVVQ